MKQITEEHYEELIKAQSTLNKILSILEISGEYASQVKDKKELKKNYFITSPVLQSLSKSDKPEKTTDIGILNKYPIKVNSLSSIFQIDLHLITPKVKQLWDNLTEEEQKNAILKAESYKKYEKSRMKEPNVLYYLQDKKFNWKNLN